MKTFNHILYISPWYKRWKHNSINHTWNHSVEQNSEDFIWYSFHWLKTMEGFDYWDTVDSFWVTLTKH